MVPRYSFVIDFGWVGGHLPAEVEERREVPMAALEGKTGPAPKGGGVAAAEIERHEDRTRPEEPLEVGCVQEMPFGGLQIAARLGQDPEAQPRLRKKRRERRGGAKLGLGIGAGEIELDAERQRNRGISRIEARRRAQRLAGILPVCYVGATEPDRGVNGIPC